MVVLVVPARCSWTRGDKHSSIRARPLLSTTTAKHEIRHQEIEQYHHRILAPLRQSWLREKARLSYTCQATRRTTDCTIKKRRAGKNEKNR